MEHHSLDMLLLAGLVSAGPGVLGLALKCSQLWCRFGCTPWRASEGQRLTGSPCALPTSIACRPRSAPSHGTPLTRCDTHASAACRQKAALDASLASSSLLLLPLVSCWQSLPASQDQLLACNPDSDPRGRSQSQGCTGRLHSAPPSSCLRLQGRRS